MKYPKIISFLLLIILITAACLSQYPDAQIKDEYSNMTIEELITRLQNYESIDFNYAAEEFTLRGTEASDASIDLALAITYPRRDSFLAGYALISMREEARLAIPQLINNLSSDRPDVREISIFVLGAIGAEAKCAIPYIASMLWDQDPYVRRTSAGAMEEILDIGFNEYLGGLDFENPQVKSPDEPEGRYTQQARDWWNRQGANIDWQLESIYCE